MMGEKSMGSCHLNARSGIVSSVECDRLLIAPWREIEGASMIAIAPYAAFAQDQRYQT